MATVNLNYRQNAQVPTILWQSVNRMTMVDCHWNLLEKSFEMLIPDMEGKLALLLALCSQQLCVLNKLTVPEWEAGDRKVCGSLGPDFPWGSPPLEQLTLVSGVDIWPDAKKAASESTQRIISKNFRVMRVKQIHSKTQPDPEGNSFCRAITTLPPQCQGCATMATRAVKLGKVTTTEVNQM